MRLVVDTGKVLEIEVGVDLRCAQIRVSQQLLHRAQVFAGLQQVRGEGVAQHVRVQRYANALLQCAFFQSLLDAAVTDAFTVTADEQCFFILIGLAGAVLQPLL